MKTPIFVGPRRTPYDRIVGTVVAEIRVSASQEQQMRRSGDDLPA
jgi:hypothetical protein